MACDAERAERAKLETRLRTISPRFEQQAAELARLQGALRAVDTAVARGFGSSAAVEAAVTATSDKGATTGPGS